MKFVITGGPGSGKSSVLTALERRCYGWPESYTFVRECAEDLIKDYQTRGIESPTKLLEFQYELIELQKQRERVLSEKNIAFLDRSMIDIMAYRNEKDLLERVVQESKKAQYEPLVFFMESNPEIYKQTKVRQETFEEALQVSERLRTVYKLQGYQIVDIQPSDVDHQAKSIFWTARDYLKGKNLLNT